MILEATEAMPRKGKLTILFFRVHTFFWLIHFSVLILASPSFPAGKEIRVQAVSEPSMEAKPRSTIILAFRVENLMQKMQEFVSEIELPEGWREIIKSPPFILKPSEEAIRFVSFVVPLKAISDAYDIHYRVRSRDNPGIVGSTSVKVHVLLVTDIKIHTIKSPKSVIAGERYQSQFLIVNESNGPSAIELKVKSQQGYPYHCDVDEMQLDPGESGPLTVTVKTDSKIRWPIEHSLRLIAKATDLKKGTIEASSSTSVDVIPKVSGEKNYFLRLPTDIKFIGLYHKDSTNVGQVEFSGLGSFKEKGVRKIDFLFRGPSKEEFMVFGFQREEYRFNLETTRGNVYLGDRVFHLSKLSEYGHYGRGVEGNFYLANFTLKAYYQEYLLLEPKLRQSAFQLSSRFGNWGKLFLNYLVNKRKYQPQDQVYSLQTQITSAPLNLNLEYARGENREEQAIRIDDAYWAEAFGNLFNRFHYRLNLIRAGAGFPGSYSDLTFYSAYGLFSPWRNMGIRASYNELETNLERNPSLTATYDKAILYGLQFRFFNAINLYLDYKNQERRALFPTPLFDYEDTSIRVGLSPNFGPLSLHGMVDTGRTHNRLIGQTRHLWEYTASASLNLFRSLSFGGNFRMRNQDEDFTGDRDQRMNISLNLRFNLGGTSFSAFYRTYLYKEFYNRILCDRSLAEEFLYNYLDVFDVALKQKLFSGHSIAFRVRYATRNDTLDEQDGELIGLVEYTIPLGIPVSRERDIGRIKGRVYDARNNMGVSDVILRVNGMATVTDKKGKYVFHSLKSGQYNLDIDDVTLGPNRVPLLKTPISIAVAGGRKSFMDIGVVQAATVSGQILIYRYEEENGKKDFIGPIKKQKRKLIANRGLADALVELRNESQVFRQITDDDGFFKFVELRPGTWVLKVFDDNLPELHYFEKDTITLELAPGGEEKVLVRVLPRERKIRIIARGKISPKAPSSEGVKGKDENRKDDNGNGNNGKEDNGSAKKIPSKKLSTEYSVQIAAFLIKGNAEALKDKLQIKYRNIYIIPYKKSGKTFYRIRIKAGNRKSALKIAQELKEESLEPLILMRRK